MYMSSMKTVNIAYHGREGMGSIQLSQWPDTDALWEIPVSLSVNIKQLCDKIYSVVIIHFPYLVWLITHAYV